MSILKTEFTERQNVGSSINDIKEDEWYRSRVSHSVCVGLFVCFSVCPMMWVIKEDGQSWTGDYFRQTILTDNFIPFIINRDNVLDVHQETLVHNKAPYCFKALATQQLLRDQNVDFWEMMNDQKIHQMNPCENVGSIIKECVETNMLNQREPLRHKIATLRNVLDKVLLEMEISCC